MTTVRFELDRHLQRLASLPKPVVAAVPDSVAGVVLSIAAAVVRPEAASRIEVFLAPD